MRQWAVVDTNLLLLIVVGRAGRALVPAHKRLKDHYTDADYDAVEALLQAFEGIVVVPQVLTEVSNFARNIDGPARRLVQSAFAALIRSAEEVFIPSTDVAAGPEFAYYGLTDAILLWLCSIQAASRHAILLTADRPLAHRARSLGCSVIDYREL